MEEIKALCVEILVSCGDEATIEETLRQLRGAINRRLGDIPHYVLKVDDMSQNQTSEVIHG
jgi:hypothetical protein